MPKAPVMTGKQVVRALSTMGFEPIGGKGSHTVMRDSITGNTTTVPEHDTDLPRGTMGNIMRTAGVTAEELRNPRQAKRDREAAAQAATETQTAIDKAGGTAPASEATQGRGGQQGGKAGGRGRGGRANRQRGRDR